MNRTSLLLMTMVAGVLAGLAPAAPAATLKKTDGKMLEGLRIKWYETRREYQIERADGSLITIALDDVESVEVDRPAEFDAAAKAVAAKQYDAAIPALEDLLIKYRRLQWDARARDLLANAYMAKGDFKKAVQVLGDLLALTPKGQITEDQHVQYWTALMGAQMNAVLKKVLTETLAGDSKPLAALAMIKRGDMNRAEGKRDDAVLDYMRVVILFEGEGNARPEALFKAAQLLEEMRDNTRADDLRKKLVSWYPASVYARKPGGQM